MTPSPVGMRCPECASQRTKVINAHQVVTPQLIDLAPVTAVLIAINVIVFLAELVTGGAGSGVSGQISGSVLQHGVFSGLLVAGGEWWRIFTSGFLHLGLLHIGMNMLLLFLLGRVLEEAIGSARFAAIYAASLAAGSLGSLLLEPTVAAAGASGAIFGLMGAALVASRSRGINPWESGIGTLVVLNLVLTFAVPGIAKGGHLGGLIGGLVVGYLLIELDERRRLLGRGVLPAIVIGVVATVGIAIVTVLIAQSKFPFA
jgi:membrane associated rhomboid family serine protease